MFVKWAKRKHRGAFDGVNVSGVHYNGDRSSPENGQRSFKANELEKLFACKEMKEHCANGGQVYKFWLAVIALYTGMRVNEICQLNLNTDIVNGDGVWYFLISSKTESAEGVTKSVKSGEARQVPVNSKLIELGFFDYIDELNKCGHKRMFPSDAIHNNSVSGNTARNFRRFIEDVGLRDETSNKRIVGMHAFRKTIITKAYRDGFLGDLLPIVGHESDKRDEGGFKIPDVTKVYIDDEELEIPLSVKKETIEKIVFDIEFYKPVKPVFR